MSDKKTLMYRLLIIIVFITIDIVLGSYWLRSQSEEKLIPIRTFLTNINPQVSKTILGTLLQNSLPKTYEPGVTLTTSEILAVIDKKRQEKKLDRLTYSNDLSQAAVEVVRAIQANGNTFDGIDSSKIIASTLQKRKIENLHLFHDTLIGPKNIVQLEKYWENDTQHNETLADPGITVVGIATGSSQLGDHFDGVIVSIYGKPQATVVEQKQQPMTKPVTFPVITDTEILLALNAYRATHKIHELVEHKKLCEYAQMRLEDLLAFGGLDNHEGFKKDFSDSQNLPAPIREYPGGAIGENLAYQHCRNMQTGESFIAPTATALIEWCFDSSTKGHREAQLNPRYNNVCSRNKNGYFVIIFGE